MTPSHRAAGVVLAVLSCLLVLSVAQQIDWVASPWGTCTRTCGGGVRYRNVTCVNRASLRTVANSNCRQVPPLSQEYCNQQACLPRPVSIFSCNYGAACRPQFSQGGLLTISALQGRNLPNADHGGDASGVSDPYVIGKVGDFVKNTDWVRNSLSPVWHSQNSMQFGYQKTGTPITIEVWDADSGLEGTDDILSIARLNVTECSQLMPEICSEVAWVPLSALPCSDATAPCLQVQIDIAPFKITMLQTAVSSPQLGSIGIATEVPGDDGWANAYAQDNAIILSARGNFRSARRASIIRTSKDDVASRTAMYMQFSFNYDATVYVFREFRNDAHYAQTTPVWMKNYGFASSGVALKMDKTETIKDFRGMSAVFRGGSVLTFGGPLNGVIEGASVPSMYVVVVQPVVSQYVPPESDDVVFNRGKFFAILFQYFFPYLFLSFMAWSYLARIHYRFSLIPSYLLTRTVPIPGAEVAERHDLIAGLFECNMDDKAPATNNRRFRSRLFYAHWTSVLAILSPWFLTVSCGISVVLSASPVALGYGIIFIGSAIKFALFGVLRWRADGWRMSHIVMGSLLFSLTCVLVFLLCSVFDARHLSLFGVHCTLFTLNMVPMVIIVFLNSRQVLQSFQRLRTVAQQNQNLLAEAAKQAAAEEQSSNNYRDTLGDMWKLPTPRGEGDPDNRPPVVVTHSNFRQLVGGAYTVERSVPGGAFIYSDLIMTLFTSSTDVIRRVCRACYAVAVFILLMLAVSTWASNTEFKNLGLASMLSTLVLDSAMYLLHRSELSWGPGTVLAIMAASRAGIAVFVGEFWIAGHALAYFVFGLTLGLELVGRRLPRLSQSVAGATAYFAQGRALKLDSDVAGSPEFVLAYLSFTFLMLLLGFIFSAPSGQMPEMWIAGNLYPVWVFGVGAFLLVLICCALTATGRAFALQRKHILASSSYFWSSVCSLPHMLAGITELLLVSSGLLMMAISGSIFLLEVAVFVPLVLVLAARIVSQWIANDFEFLEPAAKRRVAKDTNVEDLWADEAGGGEEDEPDMRDPNVVAGLLSPGKSATSGMDVVGGSLGMASRTPVTLPPLQRTEGAASSGLNMPVLPMSLPQMGNGQRPAGDTPLMLPMKPADGATGETGEGVLAEGATGDQADGATPAPPPVASAAPRVPRKTLKQRWQEWQAKSTADPTTMGALEAFVRGKLTTTDYITIFCAVLLSLLVLLLGIVVAEFSHPAVGHGIWLLSFVFVLTVAPIIKFFNIYTWTRDMIIMSVCGWCLFLAAMIAMFAGYVGGDVNNELSIWIFSILLLYPSVVVACAALFFWKDNNWVRTRFVVAGWSGSTAAILFWIFVMSFFVSGYAGLSLLFIYMAIWAIIFLLQAWAANDYYLVPDLVRIMDLVLFCTTGLAVIVGIFGNVSLFYCFSVGFVCLAIRNASRVVSWYLGRPADSPVWVSQWVFPIFQQDPKTNLITCINHVGHDIAITMFILFMWSIFATVFVSPIGVGVAMTCTVVMSTIVFIAFAVSHSSMRIGDAAKFLDEIILKTAGSQANSAFLDRRKPLTLKCEEFDARDRQEEALQRQLDRYALKGRSTNKTSATNYRLSAALMATTIVSALDRLFNVTVSMTPAEAPVDENGDELPVEPIITRKRRRDAPFRLWDAIVEAGQYAEGPLQWLFLWSFPYNVYWRYCGESRARVYTAVATQSEPESLWDHTGMLRGLPSLYQTMAREYYEEMRLIAQFESLLMVAADAKVRSEAVLFQKFLREYRFKLMANGVHPPEDIFRTQSYATVDVHLVAHWMLGLSDEQRERFRQLKERFTAEMNVQYEMRLQADKEEAAASEALMVRRRQREFYMWQQRWQDFQRRRIERRKAGTDDAAVSEEDKNAAEIVAEIEEHHQHCQPGMHGREFQFHDPEFPADGSSIGPCQRADMVEGWRVSTGINLNAGLFRDGTDPDDVFQGQLNDGWLLSAISILAASGGVGDGEVDELVDRLFVTKATTKTGAYVVRFWKNGQWETVVVDDYFPVMSNRFKTTRCAGAAFAYSSDFEEMWVPVLEKAYAKYYGAYSELEEGYVHHALEALTGGKAEEIFLAEASRGANKMLLWNQLLQFKKNKFLMGAGTVLPSSSDRELMESGLVFGAAYVIYEVVSIDGLKLLKLRNPPGDHGEWCGDWGDKSELWTRRLKHKLGFTNDEEDGTFWMSFDDFCLSFRSVYVCRYFDPAKWHYLEQTGWWKGITAAGLPSKHNSECKLQNNPQFSLLVDRPTDVTITVTQRLPNVTMYNNPQPVTVFIVAVDDDDAVPDKVAGLDESATVQERAVIAALGKESGVGGRASQTPKRVRVLTSTNVVAHSGDPTRSREVQITASLQPRMYTILLACYQRGLEGPFTVKVWSNYSVTMRKLWPPAAGDDVGPSKLTMAEKVMRFQDRISRGISSRLMRSTRSAKAEQEEEESQADRAAALKSIIDAAAVVESVLQNQDTMQASDWVQQYDPNSDRFYYYNMQTGASQWEVPDDLAVKGIGNGASESKAAASGGNTSTSTAAATSKAADAEPEGPQCTICRHVRIKGQRQETHRLWQRDGHTARDIIYCAKGCGAQVHPICAGYHDDMPPPDPWVCPLCAEEDGDL